MHASRSARRHTRLAAEIVIVNALVIALLINPLAAIAIQAGSVGGQLIEQNRQEATGASPPTREAVDTTDVQLEKATKLDKDAGESEAVMANAVSLETYIVVLEEAALPSYLGNVPGLAPTNPAIQGRTRLDMRSPESLAYLDFLEQQQADVITRMDRTLNRPVEVLYTYQVALNGFAAEMTPAEASQVERMGGVKRVVRDWIEVSTLR